MTLGCGRKKERLDHQETVALVHYQADQPQDFVLVHIWFQDNFKS